MFSKILSSIDGIETYPIISLMIFIPFFIIVTVWIFRLDKKYLKYMSELPLEESENTQDTTSTNIAVEGGEK